MSATSSGRVGWKIAVVGAGPAGLSLAFLMKQANPRHEITVLERSRSDQAHGWGIVLPPDALDFLPGRLDRELDQLHHFDVVHRRRHSPLPCRPLASIERRELLQVLQGHCRDAGVTLEFEVRTAAADLDLAAFDLVVGADGANSSLRRKYESDFGTRTRLGTNRYVWLGTRQLFHMLNLVFREHDAGTFIAHAYKYSPSASTLIVECDEQTWRKARLDELGMAEACAFLSEVFGSELSGHPLLFQESSEWRQFPVVSNERATYRNIALIGDSLQTGHFSIGSGTGMAIKAARSLAAAMSSTESVAAGLARFEREMNPPEGGERVTAIDNLRDFARVSAGSMTWFENAHRLGDLETQAFLKSFRERFGAPPRSYLGAVRDRLRSTFRGLLG